MENLIVAIALYIVIVAIAYCPAKKTATDPAAAPIDYFPQVEEVTEPQAVAPAKPKSTIANLIKEEVSKTAIATPAQPDLNGLPIRALYARAKGKIKNYKKLSRAQLIQEIGGLEPATIAA
jgi:hypothetical protein